MIFKKYFLKTILSIFIISICIGSISLAEVSNPEFDPVTMTWVAGGVGGGWYIQAGGLAQLINEKDQELLLKWFLEAV